MRERKEPAATRPASPAFRAMRSDLFRGAGAAGLIGGFVNLLHLAFPLYTIQVYDRVMSSGSIDTLVALTVLVAIVLGFQALLDYLRHRLYTILGARVAAHLGRPVLEAAVETTLRGGATSASGVVRDLNEIRNFVASGIIALPMDLMIAPLFLVVLFILHPAYGLVGVTGCALLGGAALAAEILARRPTARASLAAGAVQAETASAIRSAEVITAMGMLPMVADRWSRRQAVAFARVERGRAVAKALSSVAKMLRLSVQIAIICTGAVLVIERTASIGTVIAAVTIMARLLLPFEQMIDGWRQWVEAFAAFDRIREVLGRGETKRSQTPVAIERASLAVDRVTFVPPGQETPLVRNVSFEIRSGEFLGVVGHSGAGKSTLARLVVGIWEPSMGGVFLDGQATFGHERGSFGEAVGYLPQEPMLLNGSVAENIARFRRADMAEVVAAARIAGIHDMVGRLPRGYETRLTESGGVLSGGQRQRLALARAVFGEPRLIVLDEPNSSLDAEGESALIEAIEAARARGAAVLVVAQRMSILNRADRLLVLKDGTVAHHGDRADVMATLGPRRLRRGAAARPAVVEKLES